MKRCSRCTQTKDTLYFGVHRGQKDGLSVWCKQCCSDWRKENRHIKAADQAKYRKRHPEKIRANNAKREYGQIQRTPKWLSTIQLRQIELFYDAAIKLTKELGIEFQVDHIIPLHGKNISGLHVPWNLQVLSASDNAKKRNHV